MTSTGGTMDELRLRPVGLHWRELDGEVIALDADDSIYLATNAAGTLLWEALAAGASREQLAGLLVDAYGIAGDQADADARAFLADLETRGLLAS